MSQTLIQLTGALVGESLSITTQRGNRLGVYVVKVEPHTPDVAFDRTPTGVRLRVEVTSHEVGDFQKGKSYSLFFLKPNAHEPSPLAIHMSDDVSTQVGPEYWALLFADPTPWVLQVKTIEIA